MLTEVPATRPADPELPDETELLAARRRLQPHLAATPVEPAAACVIAALAAGRVRATSGDRVVAVMCGANVELEELVSWN